MWSHSWSHWTGRIALGTVQDCASLYLLEIAVYQSFVVGRIAVNGRVWIGYVITQCRKWRLRSLSEPEFKRHWLLCNMYIIREASPWIARWTHLQRQQASCSSFLITFRFSCILMATRITDWSKNIVSWFIIAIFCLNSGYSLVASS